jgi:hypothetical protein
MEEGLIKIPKLELAQLKFTLSLELKQKGNNTKNESIKNQLINEIKTNSNFLIYV